jgi:hypothetical protein
MYCAEIPSASYDLLERRTLIDSTPGVMIAWDVFARQYGFDSAAAAHAAHGRRLADTLIEWCKLSDLKILQVRLLFGALSNG